MDTKSILKNIRPTSSQRTLFYQITTEVSTKITTILPSTKVQLGGSGAKDTWLASSGDIDIFVAFPYEQYHDKSATLSDLLEKALLKAFPHLALERLHGSRDYFQLKYKEHLVEIVPIIEITQASAACNITDVSPLHVAWVKECGAHLVDDIRLAKQFCKAQCVYGAESYIGGVSGYVVEILVIHYGSFEKFIENVAKWKEGQVIDPSKFYPKGMARFNLNSSKMRCPLIVIDPVDKNRNAAAALNSQRWQRLKTAASTFNKNPAASFFDLPTYGLDDLKSKAKGKVLVYLKIVPLEGKVDVVGSKLVKVYDYLTQQLEPFGIIKSDWEWSAAKNAANATFYFILRTAKRPLTQTTVGPPLTMKDAAAAFRSKHKDCVEKDGKLVATISVRYPLLVDHLKVLVENAYVKERINDVEKLLIL